MQLKLTAGLDTNPKCKFADKCKAVSSKQCELQHTTHPEAVDVLQGNARPVSLKQLVHALARLTGRFYQASHLLLQDLYRFLLQSHT